MKERAEAISGKLAISAEPGKGTNIQVIVPAKGEKS
jgi:signal transduction histidine kinase